ncbi:DUF1465 family protein [Bartonella bacilliformis]|uniref:DUF1465 family protein n=1 Tax=Bartonella bacilliformis TaxID=774 RepID=UPI00049FF83A|nr:DUF1465 family protein [Bartonella bacilliformis]KEG23965.1 hypothetical protein H703_00145 [Bartonella bacilliformis Ver075]KEG24909.1 hypothetical protein H708_00145 [Bartonella bacilliformis VAB9028]
MSANDHPHDKPIIMIEHDAFENAFNRLYEEAMNLIEETAAYIDKNGKFATRDLSVETSALYVKEAMYLSTRLMQIASRLLLFRAGREGEMLPEQIEKEIAKISLHTPSLGPDIAHWQELPEIFRSFVVRSLSLEKRVYHMRYDSNYVSSKSLEDKNPVNKQLELLKNAFRHF